MAHTHELVIFSLDEFTRIPLDQTRYLVVGRTRTADVRLQDPSVSRRHACIHIGHGEMWIEDLGSSNGTRLQNARLPAGKRVAFAPGTSIQIGSHVLIVLSSAEANRSASTSVAMERGERASLPRAQLVQVAGRGQWARLLPS